MSDTVCCTRCSNGVSLEWETDNRDGVPIFRDAMCGWCHGSGQVPVGEPAAKMYIQTATDHLQKAIDVIDKWQKQQKGGERIWIMKIVE